MTTCHPQLISDCGLEREISSKGNMKRNLIGYIQWKKKVSLQFLKFGCKSAPVMVDSWFIAINWQLCSFLYKPVLLAARIQTWTWKRRQLFMIVWENKHRQIWNLTLHIRNRRTSAVWTSVENLKRWTVSPGEELLKKCKPESKPRRIVKEQHFL